MSTPSNNKPKILITGANGLLGQKLVEQLVQQGNFEVIATGRGACRLTGSGYSYQPLDIENEQEVEATMADLRPEVIIHGAAMTHVDECEKHQEACYRANVLATKYLITAAEKIQSHFIFVSTDFIFSGLDGQNPYTEEAVADPVNYYGQTKLDGEELLQRSSLKWAIARTVLVYGLANDLSRSNIILWVKSSLEAGKQIQVVDDQVRTPTLAEDLAAGCILMAEQRATGIFNISGSELLTPYQMAMETADYFGLNQELIVRTDSTKFTQPARRPMKTGFIIEKAKNQLGYRPKTFREGISILAKQLGLS
jgi:dTDP-4-dehydrorhamnose reductase